MPDPLPIADIPLPGNTGKVKLVIFDCDGVLIDSEIISAKTLISALKEFGVETDFSYFKANFLGRSFPKVAANIRSTFAVDLPETFEADYRRKLLAAFEKELKPVAGIVEVLEGLAIHSCVATSSSPERVSRSLRMTGLDRYFGDAIFTASQVPRGKPAPDLFLHAAASSNTRPEACLVIEDSAPGIEAARAAGMKVWHFVGGSHLDREGALSRAFTPPVPFFDTWSSFFGMAPNLKKPIEKADR